MCAFKVPLQNFRRIIENDSGGEFHLLFKILQSERNIVDFKTTITKARILSQTINEIYQIDPTINFYEFNFPNQIESNSLKTLVELLFKSMNENVQIQPEYLIHFNTLTFILGEKYDKIQFDLSNQEEALSLLNTEFQSKSIEYLSGHMLDFIKSGAISNIDENILHDIIDLYFQSHNEKTFSEEKRSIFKELKNQNEINLLFYFLLRLEVEDLDKDMYEFFFENINDEIIENELPQIISRIRYYIELKKNSNIEEVINCEYKGDSLDGIISYLEKIDGEDIVEKGILKLSCGTRNEDPQFPLSNLIKYNSNDVNKYFYNHFNSNPQQEKVAWIEFDFCHLKVNLSSYTIRSYGYGSGGCHPKSWRIVGSNDGKQWDILDHQVNNPNLNGSNRQIRFECENNNNYYRFIRFYQEDAWHSETYKYYFNIACFEFFGSII